MIFITYLLMILGIISQVPGIAANSTPINIRSETILIDMAGRYLSLSGPLDSRQQLREILEKKYPIGKTTAADLGGIASRLALISPLPDERIGFYKICSIQYLYFEKLRREADGTLSLDRLEVVFMFDKDSKITRIFTIEVSQLWDGPERFCEAE